MPETSRLDLRRPRLSDADAFAAMNSDPEVTRYLSDSGPLARAESDLMLRRKISHWDDFGFGPWMAELLATGELVGFVGLQHPEGIPALAEEVEVGWRVARAHWGQGLATEAAAEAVRHAFEDRGLRRLVCMIDRDNEASLGVARKLGFRHWRDMPHQRWPRDVGVYTLERAAAGA